MPYTSTAIFLFEQTINICLVALASVPTHKQIAFQVTLHLTNYCTRTQTWTWWIGTWWTWTWWTWWTRTWLIGTWWTWTWLAPQSASPSIQLDHVHWWVRHAKKLRCWAFTTSALWHKEFLTELKIKYIDQRSLEAFFLYCGTLDLEQKTLSQFILVSAKGKSVACFCKCFSLHTIVYIVYSELEWMLPKNERKKQHNGTDPLRLSCWGHPPKTQNSCYAPSILNHEKWSICKIMVVMIWSIGKFLHICWSSEK